MADFIPTGCRSRKSSTEVSARGEAGNERREDSMGLAGPLQILIPSSRIASGNNHCVLRKCRPTRSRPRRHREQLSPPGSCFPAPALTLLAARIDDVSRQPAGSPLLHPTPDLPPVDARYERRRHAPADPAVHMDSRASAPVWDNPSARSRIDHQSPPLLRTGFDEPLR
jgi:hypothetical protein